MCVHAKLHAVMPKCIETVSCENLKFVNIIIKVVSPAKGQYRVGPSYKAYRSDDPCRIMAKECQNLEVPIF